MSGHLQELEKKGKWLLQKCVTSQSFLLQSHSSNTISQIIKVAVKLVLVTYK